MRNDLMTDYTNRFADAYNELQKAIKNYSHLTKVPVVDKNGHTRLVYKDLNKMKSISKNKQSKKINMNNKYETNNFDDFSNICADIIKKEEFDYYGIRSDSLDLYKVGDLANNSHNLFQDQQYDEENEPILPKGEGIYSQWYDAGELNGTCAIEITENHEDITPEDIKEYASSVAKTYNTNDNGTFVYLLGSNNKEDGNDYGESVMEEAKILAILKLKK